MRTTVTFDEGAPQTVAFFDAHPDECASDPALDTAFDRMAAQAAAVG